MGRKPQHIRLIKTDHEQAKLLIALIRHHQDLARGLEGQLHTMLQQRYRVDLVQDNWDLNIDTGVLTRDQASPPTR